MRTTCSETHSGYLWCCRDHDAHGNAESEAEASVVATAHGRFYSGDDSDDSCRILVWERVQRVPMKWPEGLADVTGETIGQLHDAMTTGETRRVEGNDVTRLD